MYLPAFHRAVEETPDAVALLDDSGPTTYAALRHEVNSLAAWLLRAGVVPGQTVGLTEADEHRHLVACLALIHLGCPQVTLATHESAGQHRSVASRTGVAVILASGLARAPGGADPAPHGAAPGAERGPDLPVLAPDFEWRLGPSEPAPRLPPSEDDRVCLHLTSSGTTGRAKIVPLTAAQILAQAATWQHPPGREVLFRPASVEFNNSKRQRLYALLQGSTNVLADTARHEPGEVCARYGVTRLGVSAAQVRAMVARRTGSPAPLPGCTHVRVGGSLVPPDLRRAIRATLSPRIHVAYAATECGGIATAGPEECALEGTSVGVVHPGVAVEILDDAGRPLPPGALGTIRLRAPGMATRYHDDDDDATRSAFRDGWFHPGDVGRFDERGMLHVEGRADDLMNLAGIKVFPAEIERVVAAVPGVVDCAAFSLRSAAYGDVPLVAVVAGNEVGDADILASARRALGLRAPRRVVRVASLPRSPAGKIDRGALRALHAAGVRPSAEDART